MMGYKSKYSDIVDCIIISFFIFWSGGLVSFNQLPNWEFISIPIFCYVFLKRKCRLGSLDLVVFSAFLLITIAQAIKFGMGLGRIINTISPIIIGILSAHLLAPSFSRIFPKIVLFLAASSLIIYFFDVYLGGNNILLSIGKNIPQFGAEYFQELWHGNYGYSLYLYKVINNDTLLIRNCGAFYEPGRFTVFLSFALAVNIAINPNKLFTKQNIILILANITTFSTTGYTALIVVIVFYVINSKNSNVIKLIQIGLILLFVGTYVFSLDFMKDKISDQMYSTDEWSRFYAIAYHFNQIKQSPIIGYGRNIADTFSGLLTSPNGITDLMRFWGIPMVIIYWITLYNSSKQYCIRNKFLARIPLFLVLIIVAFSQTIMNSPFYYAVMFMGCIKTYNSRV